jgi:hypothetical protein
MTTRTAQPPAFTAAIHAFCAAKSAGAHDMDTLGPLIDRAFSIFNWTPREPVKPLSKREVTKAVKVWKAMPIEHADRLEELFDQIRDMPEEESTKLLDFWIAACDAIKTAS